MPSAVTINGLISSVPRRGRPHGDADALVDVVLRFAELAAALGPRLGTLEINPLMVTSEGIAAADAVVRFV